MLENYFKITIRNLWKNKGFSAINIIGLSIGLASFILIAIYVMDELSYDSYPEKGNRIYHLNTDIRFGGNDLILAVTPDPIGATLKKDYPEAEAYVRSYNNSSILIKKENQFINEKNIIYADSRKVLGASITSIVTLLSKDFLLLVLTAALIAFPVAWYAMHFTYRIDINWWVCIAAGAAAILIAFITVCFQAMKVAIANPVKSLRTE